MNDLFTALDRLPETINSGMLDSLTEEYLEDVATGEVEAYKKAIQLKSLEKFISEAKAKLSEKVLSDLERENNRTFEGFEVHKTTAQTKYSFDHNEDWLRLDKQVKAIKKDQKQIEDKMKLAFNKNISIIDEASGEIFAPAKYKSGGQEIYVVK